MISEGVECRQNVVMGPWNDILCSKSMLFQDGTIGKILEKRDLLEAKMAPKNRLRRTRPHSDDILRRPNFGGGRVWSAVVGVSGIGWVGGRGGCQRKRFQRINAEL